MLAMEIYLSKVYLYVWYLELLLDDTFFVLRDFCSLTFIYTLRSTLSFVFEMVNNDTWWQQCRHGRNEFLFMYLPLLLLLSGDT